MSISKVRHIQECNKKIEKTFITEKVSDLRSNMYPWTEKGNELSTGGEITDDLSNILKELISSVNRQFPNCKGHFTAGNDEYHKNRKSRHNQGMAVDVTMDSSCHTNFKTILDQFKTKYPGFAYIDEYKNPSKGATGGHFHISYNKNNPEIGSSNDFEEVVKPISGTETSGSEGPYDPTGRVNAVQLAASAYRGV